MNAIIFDHVVVWIDHHEAHIIHFDVNASVVNKVLTHSKQPHLHHHRGTLGSGKAEASPSFWQEVLDGVVNSKNVLIVGPGSDKLELFKHAHQHAPQIAKNIVAVETVDHPTDPQVLAYARKYFL